MYKQLFALFIITPGLYGSEVGLIDYDSKKKSAERHVILRQAFDGCRAGKALPSEQLYQLPSDIEEHIADFTCGTQKLKFLASPAMQHLIPAVVTFASSGHLFHDLKFPRISDGPKTFAAKSGFTYLNGSELVSIEDMPSIACTPNSFCIYYYPRSIVYKVCPSNFKKLHVCRMAELNYCIGLYALRTERVQAALVAKQQLEGPHAELTLDEQEDATAGVVLTTEQQTIHNGLPEHMKQCLTTNYKLQLQ